MSEYPNDVIEFQVEKLRELFPKMPEEILEDVAEHIIATAIETYIIGPRALFAPEEQQDG